jgi:hypothetical protein
MMSIHATCTFEIKSWEEKLYDETAGAPKLARASVTEAFQGDIEGEGTVEYLMMYRDDGSASFVYVERVAGRIGGRSGSFVLQGSGEFEGMTAKGARLVVPGSGTGELRGLRGEGVFVAHHGPEPLEWAGRVWEPTPMRLAAMTLDYDFE